MKLSLRQRRRKLGAQLDFSIAECYHTTILKQRKKIMILNEEILSEDEKVIYSLRALYLEHGYTSYRMSKFEEYDLYAGNKDFLVSDNVITFNDTDGTLLALKPDVTLSIIKNSKCDENTVQKLCYNENVYRTDKGTGFFKEIMQAGLECFGPLEMDDICEVILLAALSLANISDRYVLTLSDIDMIKAIVDAGGFSGTTKRKIFSLISSKNTDGLKTLLENENADEQYCRSILRMLQISGSAADVTDSIKEVIEGTGAEREAADSFFEILGKLDETGLCGNINIDLSVFGDVNYYNGVVFNGFVEGSAEPVLSGGQYDRTMEKLGRRSKAIGFAVYLNEIDLSDNVEKEAAAREDDYINIALPKGRLGENTYRMFEEAGYPCPQILEDSRKLIFENTEKRVRFFWVKPGDVSIYVAGKAADIGVCGKDIIEEYTPDIYELLDMKMGKCKMAVAAGTDFKEDKERTLRVATKFSNIARRYYQRKGRDIDIIHLNGSIEIAPVLGLSDVIVDIVETGKTLRENNLEVKEDIMPVSARLICNKSSYEFKGERIREIVALLKQEVEDDND